MALDAEKMKSITIWQGAITDEYSLFEERPFPSAIEKLTISFNGEYSFWSFPNMEKLCLAHPREILLNLDKATSELWNYPSYNASSVLSPIEFCLFRGFPEKSSNLVAVILTDIVSRGYYKIKALPLDILKSGLARLVEEQFFNNVDSFIDFNWSKLNASPLIFDVTISSMQGVIQSREPIIPDQERKIILD